ncbi:hypothetical protein HYX02_06450 [Candidatus Woesearchaeota archaeon]|nr:hypothetical protein [Candidatus Woesearchaeota archaeon]
MQFINYFFASVTSYLGLLSGIALVKIAPEEQKPLKKYFVHGREILLILISIFTMFYYFNDKFSLLILLAYFVFLAFVEYKMADLFKKTIIAYTLLGILFFLGSKNSNLFIIESSLILLYGLPTASLVYSKKEKNGHKVIFYNLGFILIANVLFLV